MEELTAIKTADGREFKPWASKETVQEVVLEAVQDRASVTAITSEIAAGKAAIAEAINAKGGSASATESFSELAEAIIGLNAGYNYATWLMFNTNTYGYIGADKINESMPYDKVFDLPPVTTLPCSFNFIKGNITIKGFTSTISTHLDLFQYAGDENSELILEDVVSGRGSICRYYQGRKVSIPKGAYTETFTGDNYQFSDCPNLEHIYIGNFICTSFNFLVNSPKVVIFELGEDYRFPSNSYIGLNSWNPNILGTSEGVETLNYNLRHYTLERLHNYALDGETRTMRIKWLANVSADNITYANNKGWTLTT